MTITPPGPLEVHLDLGSTTSLDPGGVQFPPFESMDITLDFAGGDLYAPRPPSSPYALRLSIVDQNGDVHTPDLFKRSGLSGGVEHEAQGSAQFSIRASDLAEANTQTGVDLLDVSNRMIVWYGPTAICEALIDSAPSTLDETGEWAYSIGGRGSEGVLDNGVLYPEVWKANDERAFDFSSQTTFYSGWFKPGQWHAPKGVYVRKSFRWTVAGRHWPKGWPETQAKWIWSMSPEGDSPDGPRWFRGHLNLAEATLVRFYVAGDDTLTLKIDGNTVLRVADGGWTKARSIRLLLEAGDHVIAARVNNLPRSGGKPSGFILAAGRLNRDHQVVRWLLRTSVGGWLVAAGTSPGWFPVLPLWAHIKEGQARDVVGYDAITRTFSDTKDSSGRPWPKRIDLTIPIGSSGTDIANIARAHGVNVAMLPGLRLAAWVNRGRNLVGVVSLGQVEGAGWPSRVWSRIKTAVLTHGAAGWRDDNSRSAALLSEYGRRELFLSAGNAKSQDSMKSQGWAALRDSATPEQTFEVITNSTDQDKPQPFIDYNIADMVSVGIRGRYLACKVMAISFDEQEDKTVKFTTTVYPKYVIGQGGTL